MIDLWILVITGLIILYLMYRIIIKEVLMVVIKTNDTIETFDKKINN